MTAAPERTIRVVVLYPEVMDVYADRGNRAKARETYEFITRAPAREFNDDVYQRVAAERLRKL